MRTSRSRALLLALTLGLTATVGGCGSDGGGSGAVSTDALASAGPVTITLWHGLGGAAGEALATVVEEYNATNTDDITVEAVYQGSYEDTLAKYTAAVRDGSTPDVLLSSDVTTGFLHDVGQSASAQALAEANPGSLDLDQLQPAARNYYTADGALLAVPFNTSVPMLYVNDDLLARAGVDPASLDTLTGVDAAARAVVAADPGVTGVVQPLAGGWWLEQLTAAAGEAYCDPDNGRSGEGATGVSLDGDGQREAFTTLAGLARDGVSLEVGNEGDAAVAAFAAGQVAMMFNSSGAIGSLAKAGATGYSALPLPMSGPAGRSGPLIGGAALWVGGEGHSDVEQAAAWTLVSHLVSAPVQEEFSQASGYVPVNTAVADSAGEQQYLGSHPAAAAALKQLQDAPSLTATAGCLSGALPAVRKSLVADLSEALAGRGDLGAALSTAQEHADQVVSDYREQAGR